MSMLNSANLMSLLKIIQEPCQRVSMCNTTVCWKLCIFNAGTRPSFRSIEQVEVKVDEEDESSSWHCHIDGPPWNSCPVQPSQALQKIWRLLPNKNLVLTRIFYCTGWKMDMWEFTFGAELCWEEWQDLVGIISDLPRKHFVPSVPIPIPIISFALETFCPFFTNINPGFHMMLPFLTTVRNIQTTLQVQTSLPRYIFMHIFMLLCYEICFVWYISLHLLISLTLYPH